jgi:tetratricopeptide (TPR) repeat protein
MTTAVEYVTRANTFMSRLQFVEAEQLFRKAVTLDSQNLGGLLGLARIALLQERADEGLALLDRIRCLRPNYAEALALTGMYWITKRQFDRAIQSLEQARAAGPALPIVHLNLGKCYSAIRQFGPAEASLREAIRLAPENCEAYNHLGYVQAETGRLNEGIHSMLRAIKIDRRYVKAYLAVGRLCERAGKTDLAIRLYRSGLRYNPNAFHLLERLSSVYASRLDFRSAFTAAIRILKKRKGVRGLPSGRNLRRGPSQIGDCGEGLSGCHLYEPSFVGGSLQPRRAIYECPADGSGAGTLRGRRLSQPESVRAAERDGLIRSDGRQ